MIFFFTLPLVIRAYPLIEFKEKLKPTLLLESPIVLETLEYKEFEI